MKLFPPSEKNEDQQSIRLAFEKKNEAVDEIIFKHYLMLAKVKLTKFHRT